MLEFSMDLVTIRRASGDHARQLTKLCHSSESYQGVYSHAISTVEVTPSYIAEHLVFIAVDHASDLLGFYSLIREPPELDMLFVADSAQRRGIGRTLIRHMIEQAERAGIPAVRVVSHPPAEPFYRRMGAQRTGTVAAQPPTTTWERPELWFATK